ncbi:hypothetical protein [Clostridium baratii]|uniref:hypothetical protein n=1 Tax=Clostridium baratii TaxID=1561 RepID=UPI0030CAB8A5
MIKSVKLEIERDDFKNIAIKLEEWQVLAIIELLGLKILLEPNDKNKYRIKRYTKDEFIKRIDNIILKKVGSNFTSYFFFRIKSILISLIKNKRILNQNKEIKIKFSLWLIIKLCKFKMKEIEKAQAENLFV